MAFTRPLEPVYSHKYNYNFYKGHYADLVFVTLEDWYLHIQMPLWVLDFLIRGSKPWLVWVKIPRLNA